MPIYTYSPEKNFQLVFERDISFEEIIAAIENDQVVEIMDHPNREKYRHQKIYVIRTKGYVYLVPFVVGDNGNVFLKTIIPSRKAKKKYMGENDEE